MPRCDRSRRTETIRRGRTRRVLFLGESAEEEDWFRAARRSCAQILAGVQFRFAKTYRRIAYAAREVAVDLFSDRCRLDDSLLEQDARRGQERWRLIARIAGEIVDHRDVRENDGLLRRIIDEE